MRAKSTLVRAKGMNMTQKYWITTHWPPYEGRDYDFDVDLQYNHKDAGKELEPEDLILIYQLRTGRIEKGLGLKRTVGRCGIIALVFMSSDPSQ